MIGCTETPCPTTYDRLGFTPGLRHNGQRIYRASPFDLIRTGEKTTTVRRSRGWQDPSGCEVRPAHEVGDLLEASQGGMRSGLIIEIVAIPEYLSEAITPEMAYRDGFSGDEAGAALMRALIEAEGGPMDLYEFRLRRDLSFDNWGELAGQTTAATAPPGE
jgi:hypothetical protein